MTTELPIIKFTEEDYWEVSRMLKYSEATDFKFVLKVEFSEKPYNNANNGLKSTL